MTSKTTSRHAVFTLYTVLIALSMYLFFRAVLSFPLSNVIAIILAVITAYLATTTLVQSRMSDLHKVLTAMVFLIAVGAIGIKLSALQLDINKILLIVNN
jgi:putative flippase GtrA